MKHARTALINMAELAVTIGTDSPETRATLIAHQIERAPLWARKFRPRRTARLAGERVDEAFRVARSSRPRPPKNDLAAWSLSELAQEHGRLRAVVERQGSFEQQADEALRVVAEGRRGDAE